MREELQNYKAIIQYDGSNFYGFQVQRKQSYPTVQKVFEEIFLDIFSRDIRVVASGRTDRGVHARAQVINFKAPPIMPVDNLKRVLNSKTPDSIRIDSLKLVSQSFNANFDAKKKTYKYFLDVSKKNVLFERNYIWQFANDLDYEFMQKGANILLGQHDFGAFAQSASVYKSCVREIFELTVKKRGRKIEISVTGSGFLRGMVRNIVALLILVGQRSVNLQEIKRILKEKDRGAIGPSAPACGLYLWKVYY